MTAFEDLLYKAKTVADAAGKKTAELIDVARLKMEAAGLERELAATMEGIGRLVYENRNSEEDVTELVETCMKRADEISEKLEKIRETINTYKKMSRCAKCGTTNSEDSAYCKFCGTKL